MTSPFRFFLGLSFAAAAGISGGAIALAQLQDPSLPQSLSQPLAQSLLDGDVNAPSNPRPDARPNPSGPAPSLLDAPPLGEPDRQPNRQVTAATTTSVEVFKLDSQCDRFQGEVLVLPRQTALEDAVGQAIAASKTVDFDLAGYRVTPGPGVGEVTVDLRVTSNSKRSLKSLSHCEGLSLLGGIRHTLVANGQFGINQVQFTAAGEVLR